MSLVSIIIPAFNSQTSIVEAIYSCLNQTWPDIEVIVVDDGSTDDTVSVVKKIEDKRLIVIKQANRGACSARNLGLEYASGNYIQYLDADDMLSSNKIESQMKLLANAKNNAVSSCVWGRFYTGIDDFHAEVSSLNKSYNEPLQWIIDSWNGKGMGQTSIWLTPISLIKKAGPWNEELKLNQDGDFFSRVLLQASEIVFCTASKVYYRSSNLNSISKSKGPEKASSLLKSYTLYQFHIQRYFEDDFLNNRQLRQALGTNYLSFYYQYYSLYPNLANEAYDLFLKLNVDEKVTNGSDLLKALVRVLGIKRALIFKEKIKKIENYFHF